MTVSGVSLSRSWFPVACPSGFLSSDNIIKFTVKYNSLLHNYRNGSHLLIQSYWLLHYKKGLSGMHTYRVPVIYFTYLTTSKRSVKIAKSKGVTLST
jgi:hypothetical protein